jgi:ATP-dependent DNA ligase
MDPRFKPMLCSPADEIPANAELYRLEPKFDGWRTVIAIDYAVSASIYGGRNGSDYTGKLPYITDALLGVLPKGTALDGELISPSGWGGVQGVMTRGGSAPHVPGALDPALTFVVFDVIEINGNDVRTLQYQQRRAILEMVPWPTGVHLTPSGDATPEAHVAMLEQGMEGSVCKHIESTYQSGSRSPQWRKLKAIDSDDCEIIGFEDGKSGRAGEVGAIIVRLPSGVETTASGMTDKVRADMLANPDNYLGKIVEIAHNGHLPSGKVRHPRFKRMRDDRSPAPPKPKATPTPRAPRSGPWMRNYAAMGDQKLLTCLRELAYASGDAYDRCVSKGGDVREHYQRACTEAVQRGLPVPAFPST